MLIHHLCVSHSHAVRSLRLPLQNTGFPPNFETLPASGRFNCSGPANRGFMFCSITQLQGSAPPNCKNTHFLARPCRKTAVTGNNNVKLFSPPVVKEPSAVTSPDERRVCRTENGPSCSLRTNIPKKKKIPTANSFELICFFNPRTATLNSGSSILRTSHRQVFATGLNLSAGSTWVTSE